MTSEELDKEIQITQESLDSLKEQMDSLKNQFIEETANFIRPWFMEHARREAERDPANTKKIGVAGISKLKERIGEVQENTKELVSQKLENNDLWWHLKQGEQDYYFDRNRPPDHLSKAIGGIAANIAPILIEHGYVSATTNPGWGWTNEMKQIIADYGKLKTQAEMQSHKLFDLKRDKECKEATDLWDKVK